MIPSITAALRAVSTPRFFDTERGYQGEFLAELHAALRAIGMPGGAILEQEAQKTLAAHGINIRPDLIVHVPTVAGGNRAVGNFTVFEFKLRGGPRKAQEDFDNLDAIIGALNYPLGVFVNINSTRTQAATYAGPYRDRIHFFAVRRVDGAVQVKHAYYNGAGELVEE
jgi:hypothetical protein